MPRGQRRLVHFTDEQIDQPTFGPRRLRSQRNLASSTHLGVEISESEDEVTEETTNPVSPRRIIHPVIESTDYSSSEEEQEANQSRPGMANVTLNEAVNAGRTPATPKFVSPAVFNPATGSTHNYLRTYERTAAANGWTDALKVSYLRTFLEDAAGIWYQQYNGRSEDVDYEVQKGPTKNSTKDIVHVSRILPYNDPWTP